MITWHSIVKTYILPHDYSSVKIQVALREALLKSLLYSNKTDGCWNVNLLVKLIIWGKNTENFFKGKEFVPERISNNQLLMHSSWKHTKSLYFFLSIFCSSHMQ